jgi:hypothetical protein
MMVATIPIVPRDPMDIFKVWKGKESVHIRKKINWAPDLYWGWPIPTVPGAMGRAPGGAVRDRRSNPVGDAKTGQGLADVRKPLFLRPFAQDY